MKNILVSINCITFNHEGYIREAIESFLMQETSFEFEILIGDDCSQDNTQNIIKEYVKKYPEKIKLITSERNVGARKNARRVFEASKGKYIAVCEGDDFWIDPKKLQKQVDYMEKNKDCNLIFSNVKHLNDKTKKVKINNVIKGGRYDLEEVILNGGGFIPTATIFYRKKMMENPPEFYEKSSVGDYPLQIICALDGYVYCMEEFTAMYRVDVKNSWTSKQLKKINKEKYIKNWSNTLSLLDMVNEYTKYKYDNVIKKTKLPIEFNVYILSCKKVNKEEIIKQNFEELYNSFNNKERIDLYIKGNYTELYLNIENFKRNIKSKIKDLIGLVVR